MLGKAGKGSSRGLGKAEPQVLLACSSYPHHLAASRPDYGPLVVAQQGGRLQNEKVQALACGAIFRYIGASRAAHSGRATVWLGPTLAAEVALRAGQLQQVHQFSVGICLLVLACNHSAAALMQAPSSPATLLPIKLCNPAFYSCYQVASLSLGKQAPLMLFTGVPHLGSGVGAEGATVTIDGANPGWPPGVGEGLLWDNRPTVGTATPDRPPLLVGILHTGSAADEVLSMYSPGPRTAI